MKSFITTGPSLAKTYHKINIQTNHVKLILHGLFLIIVGHQVCDCRQPDTGAGVDTLPQTGVEVGGVSRLTEVLQEIVSSGEKI